ncbi:MAG: SDR family NAD(P)-dependent oxidoreductase [Elusimicrobiota bacterium]|jgi:3-oxoacyl-[acyl-carrier protein] reductase
MILLTGATGGIGKQILPQLMSLDNVLCLSRQKMPASRKSGQRIAYARVDLSREASVTSFVRHYAGQLNRITLLHFAASSIDNLAIHYMEADWDRVFDVNLKGNFLLTKALLPRMVQEGWGRIIHISSVVGLHGMPGTLAYAASKSALLGFSKVLSREYARFNITSNVLNLGYFDAGLMDRLKAKTRKTILSQIPSRRLGPVSDIAQVIGCLMKTSYINGAVINIDGGIY